MHNKTKIHICVPTFKENDLVISFLNSLKKSTYKDWSIYIVNAYPKDKLNLKVSNQFKEISNKINIINGKENEFWSESVNRGLREIKKKNNPNDKFIIANVDNTFSSALISNLVSNHKSNIQLACVSKNKSQKIIKSGINVISWALALNNHLMVNKNIDKVEKKIINVDFLPISFVIFPIEIINKNFYIDSKHFPHYGGDYAYSLFLKSKGYKPYIDFSSVVENNETNTGYCTYRKNLNIFRRLRNIFSIKNQSSIMHRFWLVMLHYPSYSKPSAFISYLAKSIIETFLGGQKINYLKKIFRINL